MASVVSLIARIGVDSTEFHREMQKVSRTGETFEQRFGAKLGLRLAQGLAVAAVGFLTAAVYKLAKSWQETIDNIDEYEKRMKRVGGTSRLTHEEKIAITGYRSTREGARMLAAEPSSGAGLYAATQNLIEVLKIYTWIGKETMLGRGKQAWDKIREIRQRIIGGELGDPKEEAARQSRILQLRETLHKKMDELDKADEKTRDKEQAAREAEMTDAERILELTRRKLALLKQLEPGSSLLQDQNAIREELADVTNKLAGLKRGFKPKELAGYPLIGAGDLAAIGGFAPGSDVASMLAVSEQQLLHLANIDRNTSNRATFQLI